MNAADHPNWTCFKRQIEAPSWKSKIVQVLLHLSILTLIFLLTKSLLWFYVALFANIYAPKLVIAIVDFQIQMPKPVQFSLQAMLIGILTLQLPVMLFFTAESGIGIGLGVSLLLIWLLVFGAYVKIRLAIAKEDSAERSALEKRQEAPTANAREST